MMYVTKLQNRYLRKKNSDEENMDAKSTAGRRARGAKVSRSEM